MGLYVGGPDSPAIDTETDGFGPLEAQQDLRLGPTGPVANQLE